MNSGFWKPMTPSEHLAAVIGTASLARPEATSKLWDYIKKHKLQDATNRRKINADDKLRPVFGKSTVTMTEIPGILGKHLK